MFSEVTRIVLGLFPLFCRDGMAKFRYVGGSWNRSINSDGYWVVQSTYGMPEPGYMLNMTVRRS